MISNNQDHISENFDEGSVAIKRSDKDLDGMFDYSASDVETEGRIEVVNSGDLDKAIGLYKSTLSKGLFSVQHGKIGIDMVLDPNEIDMFLKATLAYKDESNYSRNTGVVLSDLMQNSYDAENSEFNFDFTQYPQLDFIANYLTANSERKCKVNVIGDVGEYFGFYAQNSIFTLRGNSELKILESCINSSAYVKGDVGSGFTHANNSQVVIDGNIGKNFGTYSHKLSVVATGKVKSYFGASSVNFSAYCHDLKAKSSIGARRSIVYVGDEAKENQTYKKMMQEFHEVMGE
jgi:glutamate synthase domain-containing protein 3